jgi:uncharacterized protein (TIGR02145 family)
MKKIFTLTIVLLITIGAFAQPPQKMSYQCVIRNASGELVTNQSVGVRISVLQGTVSGTIVYKETYNPNPQTNTNGLVTVEIGGGNAIIGTFSTINWASGPYFLRTETDPTGGTNYSIVGTSQLLSVPYALYSKTSEKADELELKLQKVTNSLNAGGIVKDIDGNVYNTVQIGNQVWMVENLKTTRFNDGTPIPYVADGTAWKNLSTPGYCWYNNDESAYKNTYGALYNEFVTDRVDKKVCPTGWHVSSGQRDWNTMILILDPESVDMDPIYMNLLFSLIAGEKLKEVGTSHWCNPNSGTTNETGFTALPGGKRNSAGLFSGVGQSGDWWSGFTTYVSMNCVNGRVAYGIDCSYQNGFSIRCVKD